MLYRLIPLCSAVLLLFACAEGYAPVPEEEPLSGAPDTTGAAGAVAPAGPTGSGGSFGTPSGGDDGASGSSTSGGTGAGAGSGPGSDSSSGSVSGAGSNGAAVSSDDCTVDTSLCTMLFECCKADGTCGAGVAPFCF